MDQVLPPFHVSISVWSSAPLEAYPTAVHADGPVHDTAVSRLSCDVDVF
jgi:hypothetical protein